MSLMDERAPSSNLRRPRRLGRMLVNLAWVGVGVLLTWGLLANPLGIARVDALRHGLLGDHPVSSAEAPGVAAQSQRGRCPRGSG